MDLTKDKEANKGSRGKRNNRDGTEIYDESPKAERNSYR